MLLRELQILGREIGRLETDHRDVDWDRQSLRKINQRFRAILEEVSDRLTENSRLLEAREELQHALADLGHKHPTAKVMLWEDQAQFYRNLLARLQALFGPDEDSYIRVSLTSLEILLIVRLLIDEGVIETKSLQPIFSFLSLYVSTAAYGRLSFESLKKRYSTHHPTTRAKVRKILTQLIQRLDQ